MIEDKIERSLKTLRNLVYNDEYETSEVVAFRRRLETFSDPYLYFAKPTSLSPLVCSRFGWKISGKDVLTCDECKGSLCVKFHPDLSFESMVQLTESYRILLANSHQKICKHYMEAKRWLLTNSSSENDVKFVVPPYFLRFGIEFQLLQDQSRDGQRTRNCLLSYAISLSKSMLKMDMIDWSQYDYEYAKNFVFEYIKSMKAPQNSLVSLLLPKHKYIEDNDDINGGDQLVEQSVLMVLFGWRNFDDKLIISNGGSIFNDEDIRCKDEKFCVQCQMCLTNVVICSDCDSKDEKSKRRRIEVAGGVATSPSFHVLNSHRSYCPFVKGFTQHETVISGTSKPCWKVTLDILLRKWNASEEDGAQNHLNADDQLAFIRDTLRSSIKP